MAPCIARPRAPVHGMLMLLPRLQWHRPQNAKWICCGKPVLTSLVRDQLHAVLVSYCACVRCHMYNASAACTAAGRHGSCIMSRVPCRRVTAAMPQPARHRPAPEGGQRGGGQFPAYIHARMKRLGSL